LIQGLYDKAPEVRLAAVEVLADLGDPAAIGPLNKLLDIETSPLVDRSAIMAALELLRGTDAADSPPAEVKSLELVSAPAIDPDTSDPIPADNPENHNILDLPEVRPSEEATIETSAPAPASAISVSPVVADDDGELLAQSYRRAAAERQQLEAARRRSNEEASRRAAEELFRLEAEAESIARLQEDVTRRRSELEIAGSIAKEHEAKLSEIEAQLQAEETAREKARAEYAQLET
jgi:hypothetical protein